MSAPFLASFDSRSRRWTWSDVEAEQPGHHADGDHVLGQRQLDFVLGDIGQRHGVRAVAVALGRISSAES